MQNNNFLNIPNEIKYYSHLLAEDLTNNISHGSETGRAIGGALGGAAGVVGGGLLSPAGSVAGALAGSAIGADLGGKVGAWMTNKNDLQDVPEDDIPINNINTNNQSNDINTNNQSNDIPYNFGIYDTSNLSNAGPYSWMQDVPDNDLSNELQNVNDNDLPNDTTVTNNDENNQDNKVMWPKTDAEIRKYQAAHKLKVDGLIGKNTYAALKADHAQGEPPGFVPVRDKVKSSTKLRSNNISATPATGTPLPNGTLSSGDAEIDKRMSDNAAYFKMTPDQRKAADAEAAKKLSQSNPSLTQQLTNYLGSGTPNMNQQNESKKFTNTVDEIKYYSQILEDTQIDEFKTYDSMRYPPTYPDAVKARELGRFNPEYGLNAKFAKPKTTPSVEIPQGAEAEQLAKSVQARADANASSANADYEQGMTDDDIRLAFNAGKQPGYGPTPDTTANPVNTAPFGTPMQKDAAPYNNDPYGIVPPATNFPSSQSGNKSAPASATAPKPDPKVKAAQQTLIQLGYLPKGSDDGIMGKQTREAQKQLQAAYNSSPQPVNPMQEHVSFGEMDSLARIIQLSRR